MHSVRKSYSHLHFVLSLRRVRGAYLLSQSEVTRATIDLPVALKHLQRIKLVDMRIH